LSGVDYGFGDAEYKRVYGTESWNEATLLLYGRGVRPTVARSLELASLGLMRAGKWAARTGGLSNPIKRAWRRRFQKRASIASERAAMKGPKQ
jgi:hypothetical protein